MPRPSADLLLGIGGQAAALRPSSVFHADHLGDRLHALGDIAGVDATVAQRKGQVVAHRHGVVDDRELEHLGDVALGLSARG
jgi:hypothetical protein